MRIAYDASPLRSRPSGIGHYAASLLEALADAFPDATFLLLSHLGAVGPRRPNLVPMQRRPFPIKEIWLQCAVPRLVAVGRPDVCHFTNTVAPLGLRRPYVVTVHDLSLVRHPEWHPRSRRLWMRRILRRSVAGARAVLCDSEATRRDLLEWLPLHRDRAVVVPLGVRPAFLQEPAPGRPSRTAAGSARGRPYLLYVGNIEPRKNLGVLASALRAPRLAGVDLVVAGRRAWLWRESVRDLGELAAAGRVRFLEYVSEPDLPALYRGALGLVYPSRLEGFGLPVLEAMASGIPVVTSAIEPLATLLGDAGWLADPDDARAWREAIEALVADPAEGARRGARGRERAGAYTWERAARETFSVYRRALTLPPP